MDNGDEKVTKEGKIDPAEFKKFATLKPRVKNAYDFPVNSKFLLEGTEYRVRKAMRDMNTDMRMVQSINGEEIFTVVTLRKDAVDDPNFMIVD